MARRIRILVQRRLSHKRRPLAGWNEQRRYDVVVKDSGSLAHVYFNIQSQVVSFEMQWAAHGELGGPQDYPFIVYPRRLQWDLGQVQNSCDLYPLLAEVRGFVPADSLSTDGNRING